VDEDDITKRPKAGATDTAHTVARAALSFLPGATELFSNIITPPLEKRRDEWIESIARALKELEAKLDDFKIEDLSQNEVFVTTILQATQVAMRNHQQEKLEALQNAVLNSALRTAPDEDIQLMFLQFVDNFTSWHLRILKFFDDPQEWGKQHSVKFQELMAGALTNILNDAFPELGGRREFYDQVVRDLNTRGLLGIDSLHTTMTGRGLFGSRTTDLGKQFLKFIISPTQPPH
jgi:hypothetical protein